MRTGADAGCGRAAGLAARAVGRGRARRVLAQRATQENGSGRRRCCATARSVRLPAPAPPPASPSPDSERAHVNGRCTTLPWGRGERQGSQGRGCLGHRVGGQRPRRCRRCNGCTCGARARSLRGAGPCTNGSRFRCGVWPRERPGMGPQTRPDGVGSSGPHGPGAGLGGFFKHTRSYPMFTVVDPVRRYDDYGEVISADDFMEASVSAVAPAGAATAAGSVAGATTSTRLAVPAVIEAETAVATAGAEVPTKFVTQDVEVTVACRVALVELEGLADATSAKMLLSSMAPRKLVRWGGARAPRRLRGGARAATVGAAHRQPGPPCRHCRHGAHRFWWTPGLTRRWR